MKYIIYLIICAELFWSCTKQSHHPDILKLPIDSSLIIIMESTDLLNKACLPSCWPRNFSDKKRIEPYIVYVWDSTYIDKVTPKFKTKGISKSDVVYMAFDSTFHPLLDYLSHLKREKISIQSVRPVSRTDVKLGLVGGSMGTLPDNVLGYFQFSPVIINKSKNKGVFFYTLIGLYNKSWVVSVQKISGKWKIINQYIIGTS
ncbi:hypothetical protein [Spirosoma aerophilum]